MTKRRGWNEGSINRRENGTWRAQICIAGKRINFSAKTRAECVGWLQKTVANGVQQPEENESGKTLGDFLKEWLESVESTLRPRTAIQYRQIVQQHILPNIGKLRLRDLHIERIDRFYAGLLKDGVGVRTIRITHSVLHVAMEKAVRYGLVVRNPAHGAVVPKKAMAEMSVLDEEQITRFLTTAHGTRYHRLYHLAIVTGMREAELFGLKWADLSWNKGMLYVRRQAQRVTGKGMIFSEPKTRAGRRTIKLGETTLQLLREHQQTVQEIKLLAGSRWQENDLIFPSSVGTPLDQRAMLTDFYAVLKQGGLPKIRFHDLRHTAASLMLNRGVPVIVVSKMLGHSKPSVTLDVYGHLYTDMQDGAAQVMEELVTPIRVEFPIKSGVETLTKAPIRNLHQITPEK